MMIGEQNRPNYFGIWIALLGLVAISIAASIVLPKSLALLLIFAVAIVKALLVALNYMHLKYEKLLLYIIAIVPVVIVIILLFALFPDFVFHH
jgi:cytochrome c oxidase subunit 4